MGHAGKLHDAPPGPELGTGPERRSDYDLRMMTFSAFSFAALPNVS